MYDHPVRAAALVTLLAAAACDADKGAFPGNDVEPRWLLTATGASKGEAIAVLPDGDIIAVISVAEDPRAQIAIAGQTFTLDEAGLLVLKLAASDGSVLASTELPRMRFGTRIVLAGDRDVLVSSVSPGSPPGQVVTRLSGDDLSERWSRQPGISANISGMRVAVDENGDVVFAHEHNEHLHVEKLDGTDGTTLWSAEPVDGDTEATAVVSLPGGDLVVLGYEHLGDTLRPLLVRLAGNGDEISLREDIDLGGQNVVGEELELTVEGDLLVASSRFTPLDVETFAARLTVEGDVTWTRNICASDGCYGQWPFPMRLLGSTAVMTIFDFDTDIVVQPFSADGGGLDPPVTLASDTGDVLGDAAFDADGNLVLTGSTGEDPREFGTGAAFILAL